MASYAHKLIEATIIGRFGKNLKILNNFIIILMNISSGNPPELGHMVCALVENTYMTGEIIRM
jgi:hypothetical protein